jgi:hypothetical protein
MIQTTVDAYRLLIDVPGEIDRRLTLLRRTVHHQRLPYTVPEHSEQSTLHICTRLYQPLQHCVRTL